MTAGEVFLAVSQTVSGQNFFGEKCEYDLPFLSKRTSDRRTRLVLTRTGYVAYN